MAKYSYGELRHSYAKVWKAMKIPEGIRVRSTDARVRAIAAGKPRYDQVTNATSVPWYVIGMIHEMEGGLNFATHLHNGDPLANRTVQVPAGRPPTGVPPFQWEESAIDALTMEPLARLVDSDWALELRTVGAETFGVSGLHGRRGQELHRHLRCGDPRCENPVGQAKAGPEVGYRYQVSPDLLLEPHTGLQLIWNFTGDTTASGFGQINGENVGPAGVRGRAEIGLRASTPSGIGLDLSGSYDGIGSSGYNAVTGKAMVRVPLN